MDYFLTEEQKEIQDLARRIAEEKVLPVRAELDEKEMFPREILNILGETGLSSVYVPKEYGGFGGGVFDLCLVTEQLSRMCSAVAVSQELKIHGKISQKQNCPISIHSINCM